MATIITLVQEHLQRCDWTLRVIKNGESKPYVEISGDSGEAAAVAISVASINTGAMIIACDEVMHRIPKSFGGKR